MRKLMSLLLAMMMLVGCSQQENIDYDNSLLDYDKALAGEVDCDDHGSYSSNGGELSWSGEQFLFHDDTIHKGYFYIVTPNCRLDQTTPANAVVEAVYNIDYQITSGAAVFHTFTMEFEEIGCEFHDLTLSCPGGGTIELEVSEDNHVEQALNAVSKSTAGEKVTQTGICLKGTVTYEGEDYSFSTFLF